MWGNWKYIKDLKFFVKRNSPFYKWTVYIKTRKHGKF